jgi:hypothetical protein
MRLYYERIVEGNMKEAMFARVKVPTAISAFPDEVAKVWKFKLS